MHATTIKSSEAGSSQRDYSQAGRSAQNISTGLSLIVLALGFSGIGLLSLLHGPFSGDSAELSATSCFLGATAALVVSSIFFVAAFCFWCRYSTATGKAKSPRSQHSGLRHLANQIAAIANRPAELLPPQLEDRLACS